MARPKADEAAERYLTAVGLWEDRDKKPGQVSGGMQQRAAVARAFAVEPRVLLLDEPFGALDALTRARLQAQLIELWQSESDTEIVVMVTHGIDEAILLSDRIVVMGNPPGPVGRRRHPGRAAPAPRPGLDHRRPPLPPGPGAAAAPADHRARRGGGLMSRGQQERPARW